MDVTPFESGSQERTYNTQNLSRMGCNHGNKGGGVRGKQLSKLSKLTDSSLELIEQRLKATGLGAPTFAELLNVVSLNLKYNVDGPSISIEQPLLLELMGKALKAVVPPEFHIPFAAELKRLIQEKALDLANDTAAELSE